MELRPKLSGLGRINLLNVLDLGCGHNGTPVSSQVLGLPFKSLTSVDVFRPHLDLLREKPVEAVHHTIVEADILSFSKLAKPDTYDVTLLLDVLEHFPLDVAKSLLGHIAVITRSRIIVWLPIGECPQDAMDGNPYQAHESTWSVEMLVKLGFEVEHLVGFHQHFWPPVDAAWAVKDLL